MPKIAYIFIAIGIIIVLLAVFFASFIAYKRTPAPKGCEDLKPDPEMCSQCQKTSCAFFDEFHKEYDEDQNKNKGEK